MNPSDPVFKLARRLLGLPEGLLMTLDGYGYGNGYGNGYGDGYGYGEGDGDDDGEGYGDGC